MATGKFSRVDGRKSSSYCSMVTIVMFVSLCLIGVWMLMLSPGTQAPNFELSDRSGDLSQNAMKDDEKTNVFLSDNQSDVRDDQNGAENYSENSTKEDNQVKSYTDQESFDDKNGSQEETKIDVENNENVKTENAGDGNQNSDSGETDGENGESKIKNSEQISDETTHEPIKDDTGEIEGRVKLDKESSHTEETVDENSKDNHEENQGSNEVFPDVSQSELLKETNTQTGVWSTQAVESQNEKETQNGYSWKVCNTSAGPDYIPCLDNLKAIAKLHRRQHYEHRERLCPDEGPTCLVPLPEGYRRSVQWPTSRAKVWYNNVPHTKLVEYKGHQNWVKVTGEYLTFPGGGTQFKHGALHYIDFIQKSVPNIAWGKRSRVILDVGCGVASFGGYLFEKNVIAMSFAPKDEHEAQVQFALERGIPAFSSVMGTKRLPFPSSVFDVVHCARCRVPWHIEGGKLLLELNRVLRPGGYFVWSATPVYQKLKEDAGIWKAMTALTKSICWDLVVIRKDRVNGVGAAIYQKPISNEYYAKRPKNDPPLCKESDDRDAAWNVPLEACMHKVPTGESERGSRWPEQWPQRLKTPPYWLNGKAGVYGKAAPEDFASDYKHWNNIVSHSYLNGMGINWSSVRNVMDMRAIYGGFAAALKDLKVWVMNVVPTNSPDTLPIIYERGLFGMYHDWCESFSTYPRTYDLLHADHLFSDIKNRCNLVAVFAEVDRILRPEGKLIVRDNVKTITEMESMAKSIQWEVRMSFSKDDEGLLCVQKTYWRPNNTETVTSAII